MRKKKQKKIERKTKFNQFKREHKTKRGQNWHHLLNVCMGGETTLQNLLRIDITKHRAWHELWDNLSPQEVIEVLKRLVQAKANQKGGE